MTSGVFIHPQAISESPDIGDGTRIWAFAHVMEGAKVGANCNIGEHSFIERGAVVGNGVTVKNGVSVWEGICLEDYVFVGPNVVFTNERYPRAQRNPEVADRYRTKAWLLPTRIREGASIGANATVLCGLTIGRYAVIAAGAVVVSDVDDFQLVVGTPAEPRGRVCICGVPLGAQTPGRCAACGRVY
jgi:UDP-2-acetamido-3-amino-2,3-dideoxy-glucuronate N-acetyltransferase